MKKEILKIQLIITILILLVSFVYFCYKESNNIINIDSTITFNKESGFYTDSITIKLYKNINLPFGAKIYYTLDGNDPTNESTLYENKILLEVEEETKVYPLKAVAFYNGKYSKVIEKTYIIDKNINENDINIISITSNDENLYDYNKGILVKGVTYDNSKNDNPDVVVGNFSNRGDEWIRKSEFIMFDQNGEILIEKDIGLGITGGSSASYNTKSLKITWGGSELGLNTSKFNLNFYQKNDIADFSFINTYNSLKLRSGSQDTSNGNIRSSLMSRLAEQSNFDGCTTTKRSLVYLNGEFYGLFDIQQDYSSSFIAKKYSLTDSSQVEKYKTSEKKVFNEANIMNYFNTDLNDIDNRKKLEQIVDMDNYLLYYAIQILADNTDWPQNNFQIWKYKGLYDESNKYTDGRYRFLIYDIDLIYADRQGFQASYFDTFDSIMKSKNIASNSTFKKVLESKYYRDKYIMITQDLLNTSFKEENILKILDEEYKKINKSYKKYYKEENYNNFNNKILDLKNKIKERDETLLSLFKQYFNLEENYLVNIKTSDGIQINFSNQELYENQLYTNNYYKDIYLRYTYKIYPGYEFKYWLVNGEKIYADELVIDGKYRDLNEINIEAVAEYKREDNHLLITEIYAKGGSDWIKITNFGKENIYLGDYYISNKENKLLKYQLPEIYLNKNDSIIINGEENYYSIGDYICNFKLKENEKVYLSKNNEIIEVITVPRMSDMETYGRYNNSNTYKFFMNENNSRKKIDFK